MDADGQGAETKHVVGRDSEIIVCDDVVAFVLTALFMANLLIFPLSLTLTLSFPGQEL